MKLLNSKKKEKSFRGEYEYMILVGQYDVRAGCMIYKRLEKFKTEKEAEEVAKRTFKEINAFVIVVSVGLHFNPIETKE